MKRFIRRWFVELLAVAAAVLGFYLLFERSDLSMSMAHGLSGLFMWIGSVFTWFIAVLAALHLSDVLGIGLLTVAIVLLLRRSGQRIQRSTAWSARTCPECGHSLRRTKRTAGDVLTWILPLRRYRCRNCSWTGLRARSSQQEDAAETLAAHER